MNTPNCGGPAFPTWNEEKGQVEGMSLRDYFAGHALQAIMRWEGLTRKVDASGTQETYEQATGRCAYEYADAMLAERERSKP